MNVGLMVVAVASGWMVAGVVLASALGPRLRRCADADGVPPGSGVRHAAHAPGGGTAATTRWVLPSSVLVLAFASSTGLAAAGVLPAPVQDVASTVFEKVGVAVPQVPDRPGAATADAPVTGVRSEEPPSGPADPGTAVAEPRAGGPRPAGAGDERDAAPPALATGIVGITPPDGGAASAPAGVGTPLPRDVPAPAATVGPEVAARVPPAGPGTDAPVGSTPRTPLGPQQPSVGPGANERADGGQPPATPVTPPTGTTTAPVVTVAPPSSETPPVSTVPPLTGSGPAPVSVPTTVPPAAVGTPPPILDDPPLTESERQRPNIRSRGRGAAIREEVSDKRQRRDAARDRVVAGVVDAAPAPTRTPTATTPPSPTPIPPAPAPTTTSTTVDLDESAIGVATVGSAAVATTAGSVTTAN